MIEYLKENSDIKIDHLIIEGTNFDRITTPLGRRSTITILDNLVRTDEIIFIAIHPQEFLLSILIIYKLHELGKEVIVTSDRLIDIFELWGRSMPKVGEELNSVLTLIDIIERGTLLNTISITDIKTEPYKYAILTDLWHLIDTLRLFEPDLIPPGGPAILMT